MHFTSHVWRLTHLHALIDNTRQLHISGTWGSRRSVYICSDRIQVWAQHWFSRSNQATPSIWWSERVYVCHDRMAFCSEALNMNRQTVLRSCAALVLVHVCFWLVLYSWLAFTSKRGKGSWCYCKWEIGSRTGCRFIFKLTTIFFLIFLKYVLLFLCEEHFGRHCFDLRPTYFSRNSNESKSGCCCGV